MKLDFFVNIENNFRKNYNTREFINELSNFLEKNNVKTELEFLDQIKKKNNISLISENKIIEGQNIILNNYAKKIKDKIFLVANKSKISNVYNIFMYEEGKKTTLHFNNKIFPINTVFREENGKYILDKKGTEEIKNEIMNMASKVIYEQNKKLEEYRKNGYLYMVEEDINDRIYLTNITGDTKYVFEEIDFPDNLKILATEGAVFQYENNQYFFIANNGYERIYKK